MLDRDPALAAQCQRVLAIPLKKAVCPVLDYLTETDLADLLAQVDRSTMTGERDYLLIAVLYDTGARIQELLDLAPRDFPIDAARVCPSARERPARARVPGAAADRAIGDSLPVGHGTPLR